MKLTFLGTSAGVPTPTRNTSSLALQLDSEIWLFDCGEADHILGLVPLLSTICLAETPTDEENIPAKKTVEIYGPSGTRELVRTTLRLTHARLQIPYRVHELLFPDETPYPNDVADRYKKEVAGGKDIVLSEDDGTWSVIDEPAYKVRAAPIQHTVRCIGYVIEQSPPLEKLDVDTLRPILVRNAPALAAEKGIRNPWILLGELQRDLKPITLPDGTILTPPSRVGSNKKAVILGDTYDASGIIPIALDADILVHECTTGYIAELEKSSTTRTEESVRESTKAKGHSTPEIAGDLARRIHAKRLVLNHFSVRYPDPYGHRFDIDPVVINSDELSGAVRSTSQSKWRCLKSVEDKQGDETSISSNSFNEFTLKFLEAIAKKADHVWGNNGTIIARDYLTVTIS